MPPSHFSIISPIQAPSLVRIEPHTMRGGAHLGLTVLPLV